VNASTPSDRLPAPKLLHVFTLPDFDRVGAIQSYWGNPPTRTLGELPIYREEDRTIRAVLVGMLRDRPLAHASPRRTASEGCRHEEGRASAAAVRMGTLRP
jgi:hypothetical protein